VCNQPIFPDIVPGQASFSIGLAGVRYSSCQMPLLVTRPTVLKEKFVPTKTELKQK